MLCGTSINRIHLKGTFQMMCLEEFEGRSSRPEVSYRMLSNIIWAISSWRFGLSGCSPNPRRAAGEVVHLDGELLEVVDARVQLGHQHEEVGSLVVTMSLRENRPR